MTLDIEVSDCTGRLLDRGWALYEASVETLNRSGGLAPAQLVVALRTQKIQISPVMQGNGGNAQSIRFAALGRAAFSRDPANAAQLWLSSGDGCGRTPAWRARLRPPPR